MARAAYATIWRILNRAGLVTPEPRKRPKRSYLRFEADLPNECWQSDFTHWPLADGTDVEILTWLDDHSRYALSCTAHAPVTGDIVVDTFRAAVDVHGIPASTLTDNGLVFTTRFLHGPNGFERELVILGIEQKNGRPNHPQTQGKVERFQQTLKKWLRAQPPAHTLRELQSQLDEFADIYNNQRPHRALGKRTPAEVADGTGRPSRSRCAAIVTGPASSPAAVSSWRRARIRATVSSPVAFGFDRGRVVCFSTASQPPARHRATSLPTQTVEIPYCRATDPCD